MYCYMYYNGHNIPPSMQRQQVRRSNNASLSSQGNGNWNNISSTQMPMQQRQMMQQNMQRMPIQQQQQFYPGNINSRINNSNMQRSVSEPLQRPQALQQQQMENVMNSNGNNNWSNLSDNGGGNNIPRNLQHQTMVNTNSTQNIMWQQQQHQQPHLNTRGNLNAKNRPPPGYGNVSVSTTMEMQQRQ